MKTAILILTLIFFGINNASGGELQGLCTKVFDGDTIQLRIVEDPTHREDLKLGIEKPEIRNQQSEITVRLIGVDTPELSHPLKPVQYFAQEASFFTTKMVSGKKVKLEFDLEREDKYGRLLAYVFLPDGRMLNAEIIKQGYGFALTRFPFKYMEEFRQYEREARSKGLGLWKGGGKAELRWLINEKRIPFKVYEMANNLWAIEYKRYIKTRLNDEELMATLSKLRVWVHELNERDLRTTLLREGWEEID
ncbi:MAG: thermonuclease family protein [Nitrospirota bacterium]